MTIRQLTQVYLIWIMISDKETNILLIQMAMEYKHTTDTDY